MTKNSAKNNGRPTISDVAELAGVSRAIASRALSGEKRPVSAEKRERVEKAAKQLGYRPNPLARGLTTKTFNLIAVVVNHIRDFSDLDLFDALLKEIQGIGKQVVFVRVGQVQKVEDFLRDGVAFHVDAALVFSDFADAATVRDLFQSDQVLMLNGRHDEKSPAVIADDSTGILEAVAHSRDHGVTRAALITGRLSSLVEQQRISYFKSAFEEHGIELVTEVQGDYSYQSGREAAEQITHDGLPEAVFCTSDAMAIGFLDAVRAAFGAKVSQEFRLYGFDALSMIHFDAYRIDSIGFNKATFVSEIIQYLQSPQEFVPGTPPVMVPTRFVPSVGEK